MLAEFSISPERREPIARASRRTRIDEGPQPSEPLPARALQRDILAALRRSGYAALRSIGCEVNGERVTLVGAVPTYHLKQLAQVFAQRVVGVGKVVNRIAVMA